MPAWISVFCTCLGGTSVRKRVDARACTPMLPPLKPSEGGMLLSPDSISMRSRWAASGCSVTGTSKPDPSTVGVQFFITTPFGT
jgi:hypothetical protein